MTKTYPIRINLHEDVTRVFQLLVACHILGGQASPHLISWLISQFFKYHVLASSRWPGLTHSEGIVKGRDELGAMKQPVLASPRLTLLDGSSQESVFMIFDVPLWIRSSSRMLQVGQGQCPVVSLGWTNPQILTGMNQQTGWIHGQLRCTSPSWPLSAEPHQRGVAPQLDLSNIRSKLGIWLHKGCHAAGSTEHAHLGARLSNQFKQTET